MDPVGFSLIGPGDMVMPDIAWPTATVFRQFTSAQLLATIATVAIAILATLYNTIRMFGLMPRHERSTAYSPP